MILSVLTLGLQMSVNLPVIISIVSSPPVHTHFHEEPRETSSRLAEDGLQDVSTSRLPFMNPSIKDAINRR